MSMEFADPLQSTISLAHKQLDDSYEGPKVKPVVKLPALPPNLSYELPPAVGSRVIKLKSLRSPKFELQYAVPAQESVFSLKERLLTDPDSPLAGGKYNVGGVRILIKARVIADSRQINELPSDELTVVISSTAESLVVPLVGEVYFGEDATAAADNDTVRSVAKSAQPSYPGINAQFWSEVEHIARKYVEDSRAVVAQIREQYQNSLTPNAKNEFDLD